MSFIGTAQGPGSNRRASASTCTGLDTFTTGVFPWLQITGLTTLRAVLTQTAGVPLLANEWFLEVVDGTDGAAGTYFVPADAALVLGASRSFVWTGIVGRRARLSLPFAGRTYQILRLMATP